MNSNVHTDAVRRRVTVTLSGFLDESAIERIAGDLLAQVRALGPDFDVITDISSFRPTSREGARYIARAQTEVGQLGLRRVVRVVGSAALGKLQFSVTAREANVHYETVECATLSEAHSWLDQARRPGARVTR